jgi:hypothetical protein
MSKVEVSRRSIPRDFRPLYEKAVEAGWRVFIGKSSHLHWKSPEGKTVSTSLSPSGFAAKKVRADLRRAGLAL